MIPKLIIEQKITAFVNKYSVYEANPDKSKGNLIALAQQKRLAFKEKVDFYSDESKQNKAFSFRAEKVMDIHGKFFVEDPQDNVVGTFRKDFTKSLLNSTWNILNTDDNIIITVTESNPTVAVLRRLVGFIPIVGDLADLIMAFVKYHFKFTNSSGQEVGRYTKTTLFRDHYLLEFNEGASDQLDWRVLASVAVALDALQGR